MFSKFMNRVLVIIAVISTLGGVGGFWYDYLNTKTVHAQGIEDNTKKIERETAYRKEANARHNYLTLSKEFREFPNNTELQFEVQAARKDWEYWRTEVNRLGE